LSALPKEQTGTEVAVFSRPRLPYHEAFGERFGMDRGQWKTLVEAIYPSAKTVDSIALALSYCKARGLDPFKRPIHIVPVYDSEKKQYVETVWPGISEMRTTAFRTHQYAGIDAPEFGPEIGEDFKGKGKGSKSNTEFTATVKYPEWCRITVYRMIQGTRCAFVGPKVYWKESYADIAGSGVPNNMWQERPSGQLEKCAEAAALRRAFPEELGNELSAEEMEGKTINQMAIEGATEALQTQEALVAPPGPKIEEASYTLPESYITQANPAPSFAPLGGQDGGAVTHSPAPGPGELEKEVVPPSDSPPGPTPHEIARDIMDQLIVAQTLAQLDEVMTSNETEINDLPQYERQSVEDVYEKKAAKFAPESKPNGVREFLSIEEFQDWGREAFGYLNDPNVTNEAYETIGKILRANMDWLKKTQSPADFDKTTAYFSKLMKKAAENIHKRIQPPSEKPAAPTQPSTDLPLTWHEYVEEVDRRTSPPATYMTAQNWWWDTDPLRKKLAETVSDNIITQSQELTALKRRFTERRDQLPK
jgi:phage recombination protein Bet